MPLSFLRQFGRNRELTITSDDSRTANAEDDVTLLELSSESTDDYVLRVGESSDRYSLGTTAGKEGFRLYFASPATSGTARGLDVRLTQTGAAGESDCLRVFETVNCNTTTCRGAHISLSFLDEADGSECSGTGTPCTFTLHIPNVASWAPTGSLFGAQIQLHSDGANSDPDGLTMLAGLSIENNGHATGRGIVDDDAYPFYFPGWTPTDGGAGLVSAFTSGTADIGAAGTLTAAMRIKVGSTNYWIPLATEIAAD